MADALRPVNLRRLFFFAFFNTKIMVLKANLLRRRQDSHEFELLLKSIFTRAHWMQYSS